jgi:DNA-binding FadR family transcriptional regulator
VVHASEDTAPWDEPVRRASVVDELTDRLRRDILAGRYRAGQTLPPERELAVRVQVTRTSLKHALVRLEELGLIHTQHGIGSIVQDVMQSGSPELLRHIAADPHPGPSFLREILEARTLMGGALARLAARNRTSKDVAVLRDLAGQLVLQNEDREVVQRLENAVMRALARATHNRAFVLMTNSVSAVYRLSRKSFAAQFRDSAWVAGQLGWIISCVLAADEDSARARAEHYFHEAAQRVLARRQGR